MINELASWPPFTAKSKNLLQLMRNNVTVIPDSTSHFIMYAVTILILTSFKAFNLEKTQFLNSLKVLNEMEK